MLFRTTSTPALASSLVPFAERCRDPELPESDARPKFSTGGGALLESQQTQGFRRINSENDLNNRAEAFSSSDNQTTPQKQWFRRMSMRRHSSLPFIGESKSSLELVLDELHHYPVPEVTESAFPEANVSTTVSSISSGGFWGISEQKSPHPSGIGLIQEPRKATGPSPMSIAGGGFGIGVGSTGGGSKTGGGGGGGGGNTGFDPGSMDAYYRRMLQEDPGNSLLLRNYARYLHEVNRDLPRAEEFYERAILASPDDAELRSQYAKLIWEFRRDEERAAWYFEQATQTSPDDCNVLGAYAAFMWDVDEEEVQHRPAAVALSGASPTMVSA